MAADLRGMAALDAKRAEEKAMKEYVAWLVATSAIMQKFFDAQPLTKKDLKAIGGRPTAVANVLTVDGEQAEVLDSSGEGLVLLDFMARQKILELMRHSGIDVVTGSKQAERIFLDVMNHYRAQEKAFYDKQIEAGRQSTAVMRSKADSSVQAMAQAANSMAEVNSEFSMTPEFSDIPEVSIGAEFGTRVQNVENKIANIETYSPQGADLKLLASKSLFEAKQAMIAGLSEAAQFYLKTAEGVADLALGLDPVTGFYRSLAEAVTGHNVVTAEQLSSLERGFAVLGVVTVGTAEQARRSLLLISRLGGLTQVVERVIRAAEASGQAVPKILENLKSVYNKFRSGPKPQDNLKAFAEIERSLLQQMPEFKVLNILDAESINRTFRPDYHPPFQTWTHGFEIAATKEEKFVRFSQTGPDQVGTNLSKVVGGFLAREKDVLDLKRSGKSADQVAEALKLRFSIKGSAPLYISDVTVPEGKRLYSGKVRANFGGQEGAMQYSLIDHIPRENFAKTREIGEWLVE